MSVQHVTEPVMKGVNSSNVGCLMNMQCSVGLVYEFNMRSSHGDTTVELDLAGRSTFRVRNVL